MPDQKYPNFKAQSGTDDQLDPLAELQRILGQDDPFKIFDKKPGNDAPQELPNLVAPPQLKVEPKFQPRAFVASIQAADAPKPSVPDAVSVDDLEQQLKSLAKDIETNFSLKPQEAIVAESPPLLGDDFEAELMQAQNELFASEPEVTPVGLRGGIETPIVKADFSTADTIRMFDELSDQVKAESITNKHTAPRMQPEKRDFAPLMADQDAITPSVTNSLTGFKVIAAIIAIVLAGVAGLNLLSMQSDTLGTSDNVPTIQADTTPMKVKPQDSVAKDQSPDTTLFNKGADGQNIDHSKLVVREEKPVSKDELPAQPGKDTLPAPSHSSTTDPKNAAIQPNQAAQVFGVAKKVKPLAIGPDGKILIDSAAGEASSTAEAGTAKAALMVGGVRVPQPRPGTHAASQGQTSAEAAIAPAVQKPVAKIQQKLPETTQPAGAPQPLSLNDISSQKSGAATYGVQLTAQRSEEAARAAFAELQKRFTSLKGMKANIVPIDLGDRGVYYRVRLGNFSARDDALSLCTKLKAEGGDCLVQPN